MPQFGVDPNAAPESATTTPDAPLLNEDEARELAGNPGVPAEQETVEETDEQKNERVLQERRERSEARERGVQRRIDELTADKYAERERATMLERQYQAAQAEIARLSQGVQPPRGDVEPDRSKYDDWEAYQRDLAKFEARQVARWELAEARRQAAEAQQQAAYDAAQAQLNAGFAHNQAQFAKARPDYAEKLRAADDVPMSAATEAAIKALPNGPAVALWLAENKQVAQAIAGQPDVMQGFVLGNISSQLSSGRVTNAPRPGQPVGGGGPSGDDSPPTDTAAYNRWAAKRGL